MNAKTDEKKKSQNSKITPLNFLTIIIIPTCNTSVCGMYAFSTINFNNGVICITIHTYKHPHTIIIIITTSPRINNHKTKYIPKGAFNYYVEMKNVLKYPPTPILTVFSHVSHKWARHPHKM